MKLAMSGKSRTHFSRVGAASNTLELNAFGLYINKVRHVTTVSLQYLEQWLEIVSVRMVSNCASELKLLQPSLFCDGRNFQVLKFNRNDRKQSFIVTVQEEIANESNCILEVSQLLYFYI